MSDKRIIAGHLVRLLASSIETRPRLEIVLHLRSNAGRWATAREVASACGAPLAPTENDLAVLCARGFLEVNIGNHLRYSYRPVSPAVRDAVKEIASEYATSRAEILAALRNRADHDPTHVFANTVLLRQPRELAPVPKVPATSRRALVAEDDADMRQILRSYLEGRGWRVVAIPHGVDALWSAESDPFGVAIVDVRASVPRGLSLVRTLRGRSRSLPVIVTTSFGDAELDAQLAGLGIAAVLEKPFELDQLDRVVARCG